MNAIAAVFHPLFKVPGHGFDDFVLVFVVGEEVDEEAVLFQFIQDTVFFVHKVLDLGIGFREGILHDFIGLGEVYRELVEV